MIFVPACAAGQWHDVVRHDAVEGGGPAGHTHRRHQRRRLALPGAHHQRRWVACRLGCRVCGEVLNQVEPMLFGAPRSVIAGRTCILSAAASATMSASAVCDGCACDAATLTAPLALLQRCMCGAAASESPQSSPALPRASSQPCLRPRRLPCTSRVRHEPRNARCRVHTRFLGQMAAHICNPLQVWAAGSGRQDRIQQAAADSGAVDPGREVSLCHHTAQLLSEILLCANLCVLLKWRGKQASIGESSPACRSQP